MKFIRFHRTDKMKALTNEEFQFFGVDGHMFKLGNKIFEAIVNPDDGYRSYLETIQTKKNSNGVFFKAPLAIVRVECIPSDIPNDDAFTGYRLVDTADNHIWLSVGTDYSEDWYPHFVFRYQPRNPV